MARLPTVYPRVCGGTQKGLFGLIIRNGLSPRVRGNPSGASSWERRSGSIPACAGEPEWELSRREAHGVYPRVCGGTFASQGSMDTF